MSYDLNHAGHIDSTLYGLDKIDSKIHIPEKVFGDATVHLPEEIKTDATVHVPETVRGDATVHVPEPVSIDSSVDLKPMAVDSCVRLVLGPVPPTRVRSPWEQRVTVNMLGVELFSVALTGEFNTYLERMENGPKLLGDTEHVSDHESGHGSGHGVGRHSDGCGCGDDAHHGHARHDRGQAASSASVARGLEIRLG